MNNDEVLKYMARKREVSELSYEYGRRSETEFFDFIRYKRVIIVGPAGYMVGSGLGEWIDSFDVVVRVNHAIPIAYPEDYGTRTDVLYHVLSHRLPKDTMKTCIEPEEVDAWVEADVKWLVSRRAAMSKRIREVGPFLRDKLSWCCMNPAFYAKARREIKEKSPNTGIAAIMHMLSGNVRSLNVVGFDLYTTGVYKGYGDVSDGEDAAKVNDKWHSKDAQLEYLKSLVARDPRLKIDDHLKGVLG